MAKKRCLTEQEIAEILDTDDSYDDPDFVLSDDCASDSCDNDQEQNMNLFESSGDEEEQNVDKNKDLFTAEDSDGARTVPYSPSYVGTPLHCAVLLGDKQQVQQVIKENGSLTAGFGRCGKSTVSLAVISRDEDLLELLLRNGCSAVAPDADARTPLHHAAQKAADGCMRLLLGWCEAPGRPTAMAALTPDQHGVTPLHVATSTSSIKCLVLLLKHSEAGMVDPQDNKK
ncbi:Ankyrin repeat-containing domain, partial [Trinorchestia longiramus]